MAQNREDPIPDEDSSTPNAENQADWEEVRRLLLGQEQEQLAALNERIENPAVHARDISNVLPQAVEISSTHGPQLARALTPAVESALKDSVRKDPSVLVNAIFPVIGPAIRRAISEALARMVQTLNQTLEHSLSWRSWRWRWEAKRTGRPFAEVVLCHTLVYRVEQLFLIHKRSGLLLQQAALPEINLEDSDMVSGMFTAIQDFVRDSFRVSEQESLLALRVGELTVWIEVGPEAYLAAVVRGTAPESLRLRLQACLEEIHLDMGETMEKFQGDALPFSRVQPLLEGCLEIQHGSEKSGSPWKLVLLLLLPLGWFGWWGWNRVQQNQLWNAYVQQLQSQPGLLVLHSGRVAGKFQISGLRDPLAQDPLELLRETDLHPDQVVSRWEPFHALTPEIVLERARQQLRPPPSVILNWGPGRILNVSGSAPQAWVDDAKTRATLLAGVEGIDTSGIQDTALARLLRVEKELEEIVIGFGDGTQLRADSQDQMGRVADRVPLLGRLAVEVGRAWEIWVVGHTDPLGPEELNQNLSRERAEVVAQELIRQGVAAELLQIRGVGSTGTATGSERDRRVTFEVHWKETFPTR